MFSSARLRLTVWYLLIIMIISLLFSVAIYYGAGLALQRRFNIIENRLLGQNDRQNPPSESQNNKQNPPSVGQNDKQNPPLEQSKGLLFEDLQAAKRQLLIILLFANGGIFIFSACAGYFLAGRTLKPIEDMLKEQNRFVADASHELRTPISAIKVSTEVALRDDRLSMEEAREVLEGNNKDLDNLQKLAEDLLSLARYQEGSSSLKFQKTELGEIIENACKKIFPLAQEKKIAINTNTASLYFYADASSIEEMLVIFLDNAVKYSHEGGSVSVNARQEGNLIIIEIKDTGAGIDQRDIPFIFKRFYRADKSRTKSNINGTGLGLSLARKIIDLHKGSVSVSSIINKGSVFTIKLPIKRF